MANDYRQLFTLEGIGFDVRITKQPLGAYVDIARIEQIVGNLLQNALKFTATGGRVALSVRAGKNHHGIITVRDDGTRLSAGPDRPDIRAIGSGHTRTINRSRGGLGLGLPLVKGLVELHGRHGQRLERRTWRRRRVHDSPAAGSTPEPQAVNVRRRLRASAPATAARPRPLFVTAIAITGSSRAARRAGR